MWSATGRVNAYCVSVSTFILTTPKSSAERISSSSEPDPPWNTSASGLSIPYFSAIACCASQDLRPELDVARLVHAVHVAEGQRRHVAALLAQPERGDHGQRVLRRGVQLLVDRADDAVLLTADDPDLDLQHHVGRGALGEQV